MTSQQYRERAGQWRKLAEECERDAAAAEVAEARLTTRYRNIDALTNFQQSNLFAHADSSGFANALVVYVLERATPEEWAVLSEYLHNEQTQQQGDVANG